MIDATYTLKIENPEWIRGHYHCKKCGGEIKCIATLPWKSVVGVRRIGICREDEIIMVEYEHGEPKWIQI